MSWARWGADIGSGHVRDQDPRAKPVPASWQGPIHVWAVGMAAAGRSAATIATRTDHLRRLARAMPGGPWEVTSSDLLAWAGAQDWGRETRRSVYASVSGFYAAAVARGEIAANPSVGLPRVRASEPAPRPIPDRLLLAAVRLAEPRTRLILRLAGELGLRRAEIAQIHARDLTEDLAGRSLVVHGKGARVRVVPLRAELARLIEATCAGGWLLPGRIGGHLSARRVGELATEALPEGWTLHTLRHRFATTVHGATGDLIAVQRLLGHASVATTQRYVATDTDRLRRAAAAAA